MGKLLTTVIVASWLAIVTGCASLPTKTVDTTQPAQQQNKESKLAELLSDSVSDHGTDSGFIWPI